VRISRLSFISSVTCLLLLYANSSMAESLTPVDDEWLKKMVSAARHTSYIGTFVYQSGSYLETSRITHLSDAQNEYERLEGLGGERSEVIRKNGQVWCYFGENKLEVARREAGRTFPALLPEQISLLRENYAIYYGTEDRVAGFHASSIIFKPRDKMRYAHKMWTDKESGLLLKAMVLDERERVIEQYVFTQLKIGGEIDQKWIVEPATGNKNRHADAVTQMQPKKLLIAESGWRVYFLPAGFKKIMEVSRHLRDEHRQATHMVYSDGLAGISVFVEKHGGKSDIKQGLHNFGVSQMYAKNMDDNVLTVVGEVPPRTLLQIAESVRYGGLK
jgi:sigma-E factor negative regulatory protein RseB